MRLHPLLLAVWLQVPPRCWDLLASARRWWACVSAVMHAGLQPGRCAACAAPHLLRIGAEALARPRQRMPTRHLHRAPCNCLHCCQPGLRPGAPDTQHGMLATQVARWLTLLANGRGRCESGLAAARSVALRSADTVIVQAGPGRALGVAGSPRARRCLGAGTRCQDLAAGRPCFGRSEGLQLQPRSAMGSSAAREDVQPGRPRQAAPQLRHRQLQQPLAPRQLGPHALLRVCLILLLIQGCLLIRGLGLPC